MVGRVEGKVALVTGGTSGIGKRTVERFRDEGAVVYFSGRRADLGSEVAGATGAAFILADVGVPSDAERCVKQIVDRHGRLDILVNNAGGPAKGGRIEDIDLASFDQAMATHVRGTIAHIKYAAPIMRAQRDGSIVNIASVAAHWAGLSSSLIYGVAKAAVIHLTKCAAMELGEDNVRVNSISPGGIATGIFAKASGMEATVAETTAEKVKVALAKHQPVPRAGLPDDIANTALFLSSSDGSFLNGVDLVVDGGLIGGRRFSETAGGSQIWRKFFE